MRNIFLVLIIICAGCTKQLAEPADNQVITSYSNEQYGYQFVFPDEWIGKVNVVEQDNHTQFIYTSVPADMGTIVSITVVNSSDDYAHECCSTSIITKTDDYIYIRNTVLDMPFDCSIDHEIIGDCRAKQTEYTALTRAVDFDKHFKLLNQK